MADATPVNSAKGNKKVQGVSADVLNEVVTAHKAVPVIAESDYKVPGGAELVSHKAIREDH